MTGPMPETPGPTRYAALFGRSAMGGLLMGLANLVPGIIVSNMKLVVDDPELCDLGPSILRLFGIENPHTMLGRNIFGKKAPLRR